MIRSPSCPPKPTITGRLFNYRRKAGFVYGYVGLRRDSLTRQKKRMNSEATPRRDVLPGPPLQHDGRGFLDWEGLFKGLTVLVTVFVTGFLGLAVVVEIADVAVVAENDVCVVTVAVDQEVFIGEAAHHAAAAQGIKNLVGAQSLDIDDPADGGLGPRERGGPSGEI